MKADKTYWLDENRQLTDKEPASGIVLINEGQEIPRDMADKYGIGKVAQSEPAAAEETTVEEKAAAAPAENKAKTPSKNKGAK